MLWLILACIFSTHCIRFLISDFNPASFSSRSRSDTNLESGNNVIIRTFKPRRIRFSIVLSLCASRKCFNPNAIKSKCLLGNSASVIFACCRSLWIFNNPHSSKLSFSFSSGSKASKIPVVTAVEIMLQPIPINTSYCTFSEVPTRSLDVMKEIAIHSNMPPIKPITI